MTDQPRHSGAPVTSWDAREAPVDKTAQERMDQHMAGLPDWVALDEVHDHGPADPVAQARMDQHVAEVAASDLPSFYALLFELPLQTGGE